MFAAVNQTNCLQLAVIPRFALYGRSAGSSQPQIPIQGVSESDHSGVVLDTSSAQFFGDSTNGMLLSDDPDWIQKPFANLVIINE